MKLKAVASLLFSFILITGAIAGPFRTVIVIGTGASFDYTLVVPKGQAITITSFIQFNQDGQTSSAASITLMNDNPAPNTSAIHVLQSASPDMTAAQKDLTIDGPATILVNVPHIGFQAVLTYKLFAN